LYGEEQTIWVCISRLSLSGGTTWMAGCQESSWVVLAVLLELVTAVALLGPDQRCCISCW